MIKVRSIGAAEVQIGRRRITRSTEVVLAVAVYLCLRAGERIARDEVVEIFWPDTDLTKGRHSLRQILYRLRQKGFALDEDGGELYLDPARVDCDARDALRETWPETAELWMLEDSGEFLPSFAREISVQFREWLDATRSRIAAQYRSAALLRLAEARREGRWADMERWARLVLRADPLNETATIARAESELMVGSKATAMEILDQYVEDLGERAGQIALPATMLRRRISERRTEWGGRTAREVSLVGRADIMPRLTTAVSAAAQGSGCAILLYGAPGVGKTRVASEVRSFAAMNGFRNCTVRTTVADSGRPLALAVMLAGVIRDLPGAAGTSPSALALLARLCEPASAYDDSGPISRNTIGVDDIGWAISDAIAAACEDSRLLINIDDLHNADDMSREVLTRIALSSGSMRLLVLATSRLTPGHTPTAIARPPAAFAAIAVRPLRFEDACQLVESFARGASARLTTEDVARIARAGGGNPLFLRELTSQQQSARSPRSTPQTLLEVIEQRTAHLASDELRLLRVASVLGPLATIARVQVLMQRSGARELPFERLELDGIISLGSEGAIELHECWHESIRSSFSGAALAALALDSATILAAEPSTDASLRNYWRAAELFAIAGSDDRARVQFGLVGDQFMARGLPSQAREAYQRAIGVAPEGVERCALFTQLANSENAASLYPEAIASCHTALSSAIDVHANAVSTRTFALAILVDSEVKAGVDHRATIAGLAVAAAHPDVSNATCQQSCLVGIRTALTDGSTDSARPFYEASLASTSRHGRSLVGELVRLVYIAETGTKRELVHIVDEIRQAPADDASVATRLLALRYRATALRWLGRTAESADAMNEALETAKRIGSVRDALSAVCFRAFMCLDNSDLSGAQEWLFEAEALYGPHHGHDLERALIHARARYLLEIGRHRECVDTYSSTIASVRTDPMRRRRSVDQACIALATAHLGEQDASRAACSDALACLESLKPSTNEDWTADALIRTLRLIGEAAAAVALRESYMDRRSRHFDRPIAPAFRELLSQ